MSRLHHSHLFLVALVFALLAAACGDGGDEPAPDATDQSPAATEAAPRTVTVAVDGTVEDRNVAMLGYFPRELTVRQGDTVEFAFQPGDPHTVSLGTLVDEGLAAAAEADEEGPPPEAFQRIPQVVSEQDLSINATGALPCFTGEQPPQDGTPCEQGEQPAFDGSHVLYSSGVLEPESTFTVEIAEDTAAGTYQYFCLLHGPDMAGSLTVVEADEAAPSAEEVAATAEEERAAVAEGAQPSLEGLSEGTVPGLEDVLPESPDTVVAGGFVPGEVPVDILEFGPTEVNVAAGESVTWSMIGFHTISFNATQDATPPIIEGEDGLPTFNPLTFAPQGGAAGAPPPPEGEPEGPPATEGPPAPPMVIEAGEWDGEGFFSSGVLPSFPPNLLGYQIIFTTPGTYTYQCLIHPDMEGTVNVS